MGFQPIMNVYTSDFKLGQLFALYLWLTQSCLAKLIVVSFRNANVGDLYVNRNG